MQYSDFDELKEIGAGGYGTVFEICKYFREVYIGEKKANTMRQLSIDQYLNKL